MVCVLLKAGWREKWKFKCGIEGKQKWANYKKTSVLHRCRVALWGRWMLFSWWASQQREWNDKEEVHSVNDGLTKDATHRLSKCQTGLKMRWNADNTSLTLGARQKKKTSLKSSSWIFTPTKIRSKVLWTSDESFSVCSSASLGKSSNLTTTVFKSTLVATRTLLCLKTKNLYIHTQKQMSLFCFIWFIHMTNIHMPRAYNLAGSRILFKLLFAQHKNENKFTREIHNNLSSLSQPDQCVVIRKWIKLKWIFRLRATIKK